MGNSSADVVIGSIIGAIGALAAVIVSKNLAKKKKNRTRVVRGFVVLIVSLSIFVCTADVSNNVHTVRRLAFSLLAMNPRGSLENPWFQS